MRMIQIYLVQLIPQEIVNHEKSTFKCLFSVCKHSILIHQTKQTMKNEPKNIIEIPRISVAKYNDNQDKYSANQDSFYGSCACCGKGIKEPKFFINTIWGGDMYPADDTNEYNDAWTMPIGSECVKKVPTEYRIKVGA